MVISIAKHERTDQLKPSTLIDVLGLDILHHIPRRIERQNKRRHIAHIESKPKELRHILMLEVTPHCAFS